MTGWESGFPYGFRVESQCVLGAIVGRMTGDLRKQLTFVPCRTPNRYRHAVYLLAWSSGPLAKKMKMSGIDVALPELNGVPLRWEAPVTRPMLKEKPKKRK